MRTEKVISTEKGYSVYCRRIDHYRDAHDCEKCGRYVKDSLDPVRQELRCKEII